jgi:hypothetical protein
MESREPAAAVVVVGLAVGIAVRPESIAPGEEQDRPAGRELAVFGLPGPQVGDRDDVVGVPRDLRADVHDGRRQDEIGHREVLHARRPVVEVAGDAVVGAGVRPLVDDLEEEPVVVNGERGLDAEARVAGEQRGGPGIVDVAQAHDPGEPGQGGGSTRRDGRGRAQVRHRDTRGEQGDPRDRQQEPSSPSRRVHAQPPRSVSAEATPVASAPLEGSGTARREPAGKRKSDKFWGPGLTALASVP